MSNKLKHIIPAYSVIPLLAVLIINFLTYNVSRLFTSGLVHYDFTLAVDRAIPFVPAFSVIYLLAYAQWVIGYILIARESREFCFRVISGGIVSELICAAIFFIIPTTMVRPEVTTSGFFSDVTRFIYSVDTPDNLLPSLHCLESWLCFHSSMNMKRTGRAYTYFSLIFTLLVFASTLLIKQHVIIDVFAGIVVCEIGQFIAKKADTARIFEKLNSLVRGKHDTES